MLAQTTTFLLLLAHVASGIRFECPPIFPSSDFVQETEVRSIVCKDEECVHDELNSAEREPSHWPQSEVKSDYGGFSHFHRLKRSIQTLRQQIAQLSKPVKEMRLQRRGHRLSYPILKTLPNRVDQLLTCVSACRAALACQTVSYSKNAGRCLLHPVVVNSDSPAQILEGDYEIWTFVQ